MYGDITAAVNERLVRPLTSPADAVLGKVAYTRSHGPAVAGTDYVAASGTGTGAGFTGAWASTTDGGTTWFSDDSYPLRMRVLRA